MKRKLWSVLLLAVLTTVLLSTAAAADGWGTGGWDVAKRQTEWKPDGVWAEGEYYSVDPAYETKNVQASDKDNWNMANDLNYMLAMSWDEDYLYTYISYIEPNGYVVTPDLWDGNVIQFSGTDVGNETIYDENGVKDDPRLEVGFTKDFDGNVTEVGSKLSINWCDWLESGFGYGSYYDPEMDERVFSTTCEDDFDVFFCDGWVTVEFRVPFAAFTSVNPKDFTAETPAEERQVGVAYVISTGNGYGQYAHTQIGEGISGGGGKHAHWHSPITLTEAPVIPERTGNAYYILFHNIGKTNPHSDYLSYYESGNSLQYYGTDGAEDTAYVDDLFALLPEDVREELLNVEGYHFVNFRPAYWNCTDEVGSVVENRHFYLEDKVSLADVQEYAFYDGYNWCIMFTACYDPDMYTVKFNNIGNVNNWDDTNYYAAQKVEDVPFGTNFYDIFPYEWDYPDLFDVPGHYFDHWRVLDFTNEIENPGYEQQYQGRATMHYGGAANEEGTYPLDSFIAEHASVMEGDEYPVITLRAVYLPHWYTIRFVDDDGVTELCDSVQLRIWDGIRAHFPAVPTKDYGTFTNWKLDWVNGEDGFYTMWYDDENNPDYAIDANLIERCAVDTDDDGVADTITLVAEYELNEDAGELRASGVIETEKGDIQWEVHWDGLLFVGNHYGAEGLVIPDFAPEWDNPDPSAQAPWYPYRTYITKLEIGSEIEVLGECAFNGLRQLRSIFIPGNVKRVEMHAFAGCENVERIDIEDDGVEFLGWNVFADIHVDELYIPASLQEIVPGAFASMGTNWYAVNGANPAYFDRNGVLFGYAESGRPLLLAYPKARESSSYAVPAGTEAILRTAFQFCYNLEEVALNSDLLALEDMAFAGSTIHFVEIPASVIFMGNEVFNNCENLTSATFNGSVPVNGVGERIFNNTAEDFTIYYLEGQDGWSTPEWNGYPAEPLPRGEYRAEGTCPAWNEKGELYWHITWDGTLYIEGVEGTCDEGEYGIADAFVYEEEPVYSPWHQWRNFVTEIVFAENIWVIGDSAFHDFDALEEIELPGHIRWMGDWVFGDCDNLRNIWLNEGLEGLGANSLGNACLDTLWIPSTLNTLSWVNNGEAFHWLSLNRFEVAEENPYFFTGDAGELYYDRFGECKLIAVPSNYGGTVKVLDGTTSIAGCALSNSQANGVILPDSLEYIDWYAFEWMHNLRELHIPASVRKIDFRVFAGCENLHLYFHGDVPGVCWDSFLDWHDSQVDITIHYLEGTTGWSMPTWDNPETDWNDEIPCYPFSMRDNQFSGAIKDTDITWYITMDGKLYVNGSGEIPDYVWDYEGNWHGCLGAVRGIYLDDGFTRIGECAFNGVSYVSELKLPENLKEIGKWAFNGNNNHLGELDLPDQVEKLDYAAFHDMGVTRVIIPASTNLIIGNVFAGCPVEEYVVAEDNTAYMNDGFGVLYCYGEGGKIVELTAYPVVSELTEYIVPEGEVEIWGKTYDFAVTDLDLHAVHWTWNLEKITLPETLRVIKEHGLSFNNSLVELAIPASVNELYRDALSHNWQLTSILFEGNKPDMHDEHDGNQFQNTGSGRGDFTIYYHEGAEGWADYDLYRTVAIGDDGIIAGGAIDGTDIEWTLTVDGKLNVTGSGEIPDNLEGQWKDYLDDVRELYIDDRITRIGNHAFNPLNHLEKLHLPDALESIGDGGVRADVGISESSVGELVLPEGLKYIGGCAFHGMGITKVTLPAGVQDIIDNVFSSNPITEFVMAEQGQFYDVDEYGVLYALGDAGYKDLVAYPAASEMTSYTIPNGVERVVTWGILGTENLADLTLPDTVEHLGFEAISHNWNMTSLTIPASVKTIEELCFWGNDLSYIIFEGDMPELSSNEEEGEGSQFWDNAEDFTIYYHAGAEGWADYDLYPTVAMAPTDRGDVDGDNMTTEKDLAILTQFFAGYAHVIDEDKLDIDGEDGLTRKDIMILNRYLAGWEDYDRYFTE